MLCSHIYPTDKTKIGLIIILLAGSALMWLSSLLEVTSSLLKGLDEILDAVSCMYPDPLQS